MFQLLKTVRKSTFKVIHLVPILIFCLTSLLHGQSPGDVTSIDIQGNILILQSETDIVEIEAVAQNAVRVNFQPGGKEGENTLVVSRDNWLNIPASVDTSGNPIIYQFGGNRIEIGRNPLRIRGFNAQGMEVFEEPEAGGFSAQELQLSTVSFNFYGIDNRTQGSLTTNNGDVIDAGSQGGAGAPFFWTTDGWGMIADANGGDISISGGSIHFRQGEATDKADVEVFFVFGTPKEIFKGKNIVTGPPPLLPEYSYGFLNTEWGMDEQELRNDVSNYRQKEIPLDAYILDFDWMPWGEDNYGEFRWGPKFPSGPSGKLKTDMLEKGVRILGIRKPRIHTGTVQGNEAESKGFFYDKQIDFFSNKEVGRIDFNIPEARAWYWDTYINKGAGYENGVAGYWNDEADEYGGNFMFMQMQRSQFEGQRSLNNKRVWSINRNFYLGAQRFSYAMWSGDIGTGFNSMADQRLFMLTSTALGAPWWGMDIGGFNGTPSPENYYRWIQFGAFVPVFRVHGTEFEEREPWNFGPEAEAIATKYIRLRYKLLPYIYTTARQLHDTGVPMVRPLIMEYPDDPNVVNRFDGWHFGDDLLVYPVVNPAQETMSLYLPEGEWVDFRNGRVLRGPATINYMLTAEDIPVFVKAGAILPGAPVGDFVKDPEVQDVRFLMAFGPGEGNTQLYEDDGETFDYENSEFTRTAISHVQTSNTASLQVEPQIGNFQTPERDYIADFRFTNQPDSVFLDGNQVQEITLDTLLQTSKTGWSYDENNRSTFVRFNDDKGGHEIQLFLKKDKIAPVADSLTVLSDTTLSIHFSEPVLADSSQHSALNPDNYSISGSVLIKSIEGSFDMKTTTLITTSQERGSSKTLNVSNIADQSEQTNIMEAAEFSYTVPTIYNKIVQEGLQGFKGTMDAHIAEFFPDNNMGGNDQFEAARFDGASENDDKSMLVQFDLSNIDINDTTLVRATLVLTMAETRNGDNPKKLGVFRLLKNWNQGDNEGIDGGAAGTGEVTWNSSRNNLERWDKPGGDHSGDAADIRTVGADIGKEYEWDITSFVTFWEANPDRNFGMILREPESSDRNGTKVFFTSEHNTIEDRPKLILTFDAAATATDITDEDGQIPQEFKLEQNYPNPFNPTTTITYQLPRSSTVNLTIYNYLGQEVKSLIQNNRQSAGVHTVQVNAADLASGVYIYRLEAGSFNQVRKMVLIK